MNMGLSEEAIKTILGIKEPVYLTTESMIENLTVTFFPFHKTTDKEILTFREKLEAVLKDLGVNILLYEQALGKRDKIKKGIAIIATGDGEPGNLAVDHVMNPRNNPIVTIVKEPSTLLDETASFEEHMNIAIKLFAYHMSNIIICAGKKEWIVYSLNGYSPLYKIEEDFSRRVSRALIPKLTAPIRPPLLSEFKIEEWDIDTRASFDRRYIKDIVEASRLFKKTALYPPARAFETLSFRSTLYKKIGKRYLDRRSGMSYGFFVRQLPQQLSTPMFEASAKKTFEEGFLKDKDWFVYDNNIYISLNTLKERMYMPVPEVWVITSRSGCEKTDVDPHKDLIKIGLINGQMIIAVPPDISLASDYKPSFDTKLILSQAVANAIYGSILAHFKPRAVFPKILRENGMALAHWHGYILLEHIPEKWYVHGITNPAVCCSTHQAAIYAFRGKEEFFKESLFYDREYVGDIHIEPYHGINVASNSLVELAKFLLLNPQAFKLGALELQES